MTQEELMETLWMDVQLGRCNYSKFKGILQDAWENGHEAAEVNVDRLLEMMALKGAEDEIY